MGSLVTQLVMQIAAASLPGPVVELKFHPSRRWRFDLAWPERRVACEIHGGTWTGGRHVTGAGFALDREKMNEAALLGWLVIEVTSSQIHSGEALAWIELALKFGGRT